MLIRGWQGTSFLEIFLPPGTVTQCHFVMLHIGFYLIRQCNQISAVQFHARWRSTHFPETFVEATDACITNSRKR